MSQLSHRSSDAVSRTNRSDRASRLPALLLALVLGPLGLLAACGGGDDANDTSSSEDASGNEQTAEETEADDSSANPGGDEVFDPATVKSCLEDAGFQTVTSSEVLSDQQVADQLTAFGQTESLTFEAEQNSFAGGVSFYESPEQANDRAESLANVAKAQTVVGNALVSIEAGSDYDEAVEAAESCLGV